MDGWEGRALSGGGRPGFSGLALNCLGQGTLRCGPSADPHHRVFFSALFRRVVCFPLCLDLMKLIL